MSRLLIALSLSSMLLACGGGSESPEAGATAGGEEGGADQEAGAAPVAEEGGIVDPVKVSPEVYKVILENDRMRILEATWKPDQRDEFHGHPHLVAYALTPIHGLGYDADESHVSIRIREGHAYYQEGVPSHAFENRGTNTAKMIIVEMKGGQPSAKPPKHSAWDARETSPEIYDLMLINPEVRVLLGTWEPGQEDREHSHPALAAYAVTDIKAELTDEDGNKTALNKKAGDVLFQDPVKSHTFKNLAETPAKLLLIELRR